MSRQQALSSLRALPFMNPDALEYDFWTFFSLSLLFPSMNALNAIYDEHLSWYFCLAHPKSLGTYCWWIFHRIQNTKRFGAQFSALSTYHDSSAGSWGHPLRKGRRDLLCFKWCKWWCTCSNCAATWRHEIAGYCLISEEPLKGLVFSLQSSSHRSASSDASHHASKNASSGRGFSIYPYWFPFFGWWGF